MSIKLIQGFETHMEIRNTSKTIFLYIVGKKLIFSYFWPNIGWNEVTKLPNVKNDVRNEICTPKLVENDVSHIFLALK